jgi:DNA segregation ATPase FtsK/SpoIIIE, S-DNA-T family
MSRTTAAAVGNNVRGAKLPTLSSRALQLTAEIKWITVLVFSALLFLVLVTYSRQDPGWSHAGAGEATRNLGGTIGAYVADLSLFLFGLSTYWFVVLGAVAVWRGYHEILESRKQAAAKGNVSATAQTRARMRAQSQSKSDENSGEEGLAHWERWVGFALLILGSSAIESSRMYSLSAQLPMAPGGVVGDLIGSLSVQATGAVGSLLILLLMFAAGFSLFFSVSWITLFERIGSGIEWVIARAQQMMVARKDRQVGEQAASKRLDVIEEKKRVLMPLAAEPVHIEAPVIVEKSKQAYKEEQSNLFADLIGETKQPEISLLEPPPATVERIPPETLEYTSRLIEKKLSDFGVVANVIAAYPGPVITRYEIEPAIGVKGSQIMNLSKDLSRALSMSSIRVVETIPGKSLMGLELPNPRRQIVRLSEILASEVFGGASSPVTLALGKDIAGNPVCADLAKMPHLLVAGTTGSGKSVGINAMLLSLLYKADPNQVRLILIDPKMLEMSVYEGIPHLLAPVVTDMKQAGNALNWCVAEMERRYKLMSKMGVRNLGGFNTKLAEARKKGETIPNPFSLTPDAPEPLNHLPQIVVVIDELADLMMVVGKKIEELIARLAQKARAAGIHLILATQRPSVDVITGLIKANIPTRIAFQVSSKIDSRTILDQSGAESLLGQGDMLYMPPGNGVPQRVHGAYVADEEVHAVVNHWRRHGEPQYIEGLLEGGIPESSEQGSAVGFGGLSSTLAEAGVDGESDALYDQAVAIVLQQKRASISLVQRHLRIGYNRAARLLEQMEKSGLVSTMSSNGNRDILVPQSRAD